MVRHGPEAEEPGRETDAKARAQVLVFNTGGVPTQPMRFDRGTQIRLFNRETGAQNLDVHINVLNVDSGPGPYHYHALAENVYLVLEGTVQVIVEGRRYVLNENDVAFIPPGVRHAAGNGGSVPARVIEIYAPSGLDFNMVEGPEVLATWVEPRR